MSSSFTRAVGRPKNSATQNKTPGAKTGPKGPHQLRPSKPRNQQQPQETGGILAWVRRDSTTSDEQLEGRSAQPGKSVVDAAELAATTTAVEGGASSAGGAGRHDAGGASAAAAAAAGAASRDIRETRRAPARTAPRQRTASALSLIHI